MNNKRKMKKKFPKVETKLYGNSMTGTEQIVLVITRPTLQGLIAIHLRAEGN
jgi:hypothetical protein